MISKPPEFMLLSGDAPDGVDLELYRGGAISDPEQRAVMDAAVAEDLAALDAELQAFEHYWADNAPPLPGTERRAPLTLEEGALAKDGADDSEEHARGGRVVSLFRRRSTVWAAAAAVLLVLGGLWMMPPGNQAERARSMGRLAIETALVRDGQPMELRPGELRDGDRIHFAVRLPQAGYAVLATVQEDGRAFVLQRSEPGHPAPAGSLFMPAGAIELDGYSGREHLILAMHDDYLNDADMRAFLESLRDDPESSEAVLWTLDLDRIDE